MTKIKEWKYDEISTSMIKYHMEDNLNEERTGDEINQILVDSEKYVHLNCRVEVLKETEKAVQIRIADVFSAWCPKSAIVLA